jgi:hypothetical protein
MIMVKIKDMLKLTVGASLVGGVLHSIGNIGSGMSSGMKGATQSMVSVGFLSSASKLFKKK